MTPREPDRYDKAALEIWGGDFTPAGFAAALRAVEAETIERALACVPGKHIEIGDRIRALASPAAAPAAEPRDVVTGTARETYAGIDFTRGAPLSEPAAPAPSEVIRLLERIRSTAKGHMEYFAGEIFSDANEALRILLATSPPGAGEGT